MRCPERSCLSFPSMYHSACSKLSPRNRVQFEVPSIITQYAIKSSGSRLCFLLSVSEFTPGKVHLSPPTQRVPSFDGGDLHFLTNSKLSNLLYLWNLVRICTRMNTTSVRFYRSNMLDHCNSVRRTKQSCVKFAVLSCRSIISLIHH